MSDVKDWVSESRARCEAATEGPWHVPNDGYVGSVDYYNGAIAQTQMLQEFAGSANRQRGRAENAAFIASARTDLPRALSVVEAADRLVTAGYQHSICKGAWEPLQGTETWSDKARCCPFCAAFAAYRSVRK